MPTVVFDVNETLLDLAVLDAPFRETFGVDSARREWFTQLLQQSMVVSATGTHRDFRVLAAEALDVVAWRHGVSLDERVRASILGLIAELPAHPEVPGALERMRGLGGLRLEGLMVLPPYLDPDEVRPYFRRLRALRDRAVADGLLEGRELSMGMSHDFEVAVEEGATMVRVGSAIFGERTAAA